MGNVYRSLDPVNGDETWANVGAMTGYYRSLDPTNGNETWVSVGTLPTGGGSPLMAAAGTDTSSLGTVSGSAGAQPAGKKTDALGTLAASTLLQAGTLAQSETQTSSAVSNATAGTETSALGSVAGVSGAQPVGTESASMNAVQASSQPIGNTKTATSTGSWTSATSAQGAPDGTSATMTATQSGLNASTGSGVLTCSSIGLGVTPSGCTRNKVELLVKELIKTTRAGLDLASTMSAVLSIQKANGTASTTVASSTNATGARADTALVADTYDITSAVSTWTDAELQGIVILFTGSYNLSALSGSTYTWSVDACQVRVTYSARSFS